MRLPAVLAATGWAKPTLVRENLTANSRKGSKLDPDARAVVWCEDEVEAFQKAAVAGAMEAA